MDELLSSRSTGFHPAGGVILLPAVRTITWATITSPLVVPAGSPMVSVEPPASLIPLAAARSDISPPVGCFGVGDGLAVAPAGLSAISIVIFEFPPPLF